MLCAASFESVIAQQHFDWTMKDDVAQWGSTYTSRTGGSYTRSNIGGPNHTSGSYAGGSGLNEGPYDGRSGIVRSWVSTGTSTRTDPDNIFDLSTVGSTATVRTVYHGLGSQSGSGGSGHIFQFGLTANADYFGAPNDESLFIAGDFKGYNSTTDVVAFDLDLMDQSGADQAPTDGVWNINPLVNVADGLVLDRIFIGSGVSQALELRYTNVGNGQMKIDVGMMALDISGRRDTDVMTDTELIVQESYTVAHSFSDLSNLRVGFGLSLNDSDIPMSGANFDWEAAYPTGFAVPEPSTALLALGLMPFALLRRRRP